MRQKADKLEKGKWYADTSSNYVTKPTFFRYEYSNPDEDEDVFDLMIGDDYHPDSDRKYRWWNYTIWYLPTPEDIEKYNLNETE